MNASAQNKILIVDDDATSRITLKKILSTLGEISVAENGAQALSLFQEAIDTKSPFTLIVLDILMPGLSGHQVLDTIRSTEASHGIVPGEGCKVIMVTSADDETSMFESHILGCEGYILKPFSRAQVKETLLEIGVWQE